MTPIISRNELRRLGEGHLAYVRPISGKELMESPRLLVRGAVFKPDQVLFIITSASGDPYEIVDEREEAFSEARRHGLVPVPVH